MSQPYEPRGANTPAVRVPRREPMENPQTLAEGFWISVPRQASISLVALGEIVHQPALPDCGK